MTISPTTETAPERPSPKAASVTVLIPCLNEAETIAECVRLARTALDDAGFAGEVVVVDNGSMDGSAELAAGAGARVVNETRRGYGSAYLAGFREARGDYIVMADGDLSYDFGDIPRFVDELDRGADFVIGNRMENIAPGAMPWLNRYVGNPVLTGILNLFFRTGVRDAHCGMRAVRREVLPRLDLRATGMEFASEMVIRVAKERLRVTQFPIEYHPRGGESKLSPLRDGWRHLRLLLVYSPTYLFIVPGVAMAAIGAVVIGLVLSKVELFGRVWQVHSLVAGAMLAIVGTQVAGLGVCARAFGIYYLHDRSPRANRLLDRFRLEHGLALGAATILIGLALEIWVVAAWVDRGFGQLSEERLAIVAATVMIIGVQIFFTSFLVSVLGLRRET
jgi:glycosyltransferase involved in cell wall biosynthesis